MKMIWYHDDVKRFDRFPENDESVTDEGMKKFAEWVVSGWMIRNIDFMEECGIYSQRDKERFADILKESLFPNLHVNFDFDFNMEFEDDNDPNQITYNDLLTDIEKNLRITKDLLVHYLISKTISKDKLSTLAEFIEGGMYVEYFGVCIFAEHLSSYYVDCLSGDMIEFLDRCMQKRAK